MFTVFMNNGVYGNAEHEIKEFDNYQQAANYAASMNKDAENNDFEPKFYFIKTENGFCIYNF